MFMLATEKFEVDSTSSLDNMQAAINSVNLLLETLNQARQGEGLESEQVWTASEQVWTTTKILSFNDRFNLKQACFLLNRCRQLGHEEFSTLFLSFLIKHEAFFFMQ